MGVTAQATSASPFGIAGHWLRIAGSKSFLTLRSLLFDHNRILTDAPPLAMGLPPTTGEASSSRMKRHSRAGSPLYRIQNPFIERALAGMATGSPLPDMAEEPSVPKPRTIPTGCPNQKASTPDGKQITKKSKSPPQRQSFGRAQSQPSGKPVRQQRRVRLRRA